MDVFGFFLIALFVLGHINTQTAQIVFTNLTDGDNH